MFLYKDLRIFYSPFLNFEPHINITFSKYIKILGFIKRNFRIFTSHSFLCSFYFTLVCPTLEYDVIVWNQTRRLTYNINFVSSILNDIIYVPILLSSIQFRVSLFYTIDQALFMFHITPLLMTVIISCIECYVTIIKPSNLIA